MMTHIAFLALLMVLSSVVSGYSRTDPSEPSAEWAAARSRTEVFQEVVVEHRIHEEIAVTYYTIDAPLQKLPTDCWLKLLEDRETKRLDLAKQPMMDRVGYLILKSGEEYYLIFLEERDTLTMFRAGASPNPPFIFQPYYGRRGQAWCFKSAELHKKLMSLPGVALTEEELLPWQRKKSTGTK